ncbi:MAG: hypothetical protein WA957_09850, partial [Alteraurantiacibacter sp.]
AFSIENPNSVDNNSIGSRTYVDVLATYRLATSFAEEIELYAGVDNLFDRDPPRFPGANGAGNNVLFSPVGRFVKGGVRMKF